MAVLNKSCDKNILFS